MMKPHQKRAGEEQPNLLAKRLRADPRISTAPTADTATCIPKAQEELPEDGGSDRTPDDESVESTSNDESGTASVSEDLSYTGDDPHADTHRGSDLVCYGMVSGRHSSPIPLRLSADLSTQLEGVQCQVLRGRSIPDTRYSEGDNGDYVKLSLYSKETQVTVGISDDDAFAQLNAVATTTLRQVAALPYTLFHAYMARESFEDLLSKRKVDQGTAAVRFKLNMNITGPSLDGELVGEILSNRDLFLQEPLQRKEHYPYENPHVWKFEDLPDIDVWLAERTQARSVGEQMVLQQGWNHVLDELPDFDTSHSDLDLSRLKTQLLK